MPFLPSDLRNKLERTIIKARDAAEAGARAALEAMAVHHYEPYPHMKPAQRELRNHLRARARQLGDRQDPSGRLAIDHLAGECAYEQWHRMLFARFLAENELLIEPQENMAISLAEAEELAKEESVDVWVFASRCAERMLPQIFRPEDPLLQVAFATEHMLKLEKLLASLPEAVFAASDALGWVYQFWQSKKKDEVNRSEVKIGADELPAVTQLFTEPYMVSFLLHNTLGAWWAGKKLTSKDTASAKGEDELRRKLALPGVTWEFLRFVRTSPSPSKGEGRGEGGGPWRPVAGNFAGWPRTAAKLKMLDPCCGSGHFAVATLHHLVPIRMAEEGLSAAQAVDAVLRDNLHGLEIDERCCQIAAFALAFAAWTYPEAGGYRRLPDLHIACTGIGPQSTEEQWIKLAEQSGIPMRPDERERIKNGLLKLYRLFSQAPTLGSLINPAELPADLLTAGYQTIQPYLAAILKGENADDQTRERAITAAGMAKAADLLAGEYALVITNVPYLGRGSHSDNLLRFGEGKNSNADLCTMMIQRCFAFLPMGCTCASVLPQNWWVGRDYRFFRRDLLAEHQIIFAIVLGEEAWRAFGNRGPHTVLMAFNTRVTMPNRFCALDVSTRPNARVVGIDAKSEALRGKTLANFDSLATVPHFVDQMKLRTGRDWRISIFGNDDAAPLSQYVDAGEGCSTGDKDRFAAMFWEFSDSEVWFPYNAPGSKDSVYCDSSQVMRWENGNGVLASSRDARIQNTHLWRRTGILVGRVRGITATLSTHGAFTKGAVMVAPRDESDAGAIYCFLSSEDYERAVRALDSRVSAATSIVTDVSVDLTHWQKVAAQKYPEGLPEPESDDPAQWLFHGRPEESTAPLQVAVARLLGYRWPAEFDDKMRLSKRAQALVKSCDELGKFPDEDGIVCIPSVRGEEPAAERLLALLTACGLKPDKVRELAGGTDLDDWLRNSFFGEHCKLFHDRPFVWHIWDGRKRDGFQALVNYHKLAEGGGKGRKLLENLSYSYLGEWIGRQQDGVKRGEEGSEDRLAAAMELQKRLVAILEGEPPFDIFVRWKPLNQQPIGWEPDINDGVRLNIRPFMASDLPNGRSGAGILRWKPNIKWKKDRGKEPHRPKSDFPWFWGWDGKVVFMGGKEFKGERFNDCHYTIAAKQQARDSHKK
jgi:hypothetical protein